MHLAPFHGWLTLPLLACVGCSEWEAGPALPVSSDGGGGEDGACPEAFDPRSSVPVRTRSGFRVVANTIEDSEGQHVMLRGVNRSGSEYQCTKGRGFFDGPSDEESVRAMARWNINAVRVPLNEACWLGINGTPDFNAGEPYKAAVESYVELLQRYGLIPILDLHWAAPGDRLPTELYPMPNADHTETFWADVAETFKGNDGVIFEPYNEPFPNRNQSDDAAWACWRDGCTEFLGWGSSETYEAVGMQALVDAIRSTGSEHLLLLGGVQYSNGLSRWLEFKPDDPMDNLAPAWHVYNYNHCANEACWIGAPREVAEQYPIVVTELGQNDCEGTFVSTLMGWLEQHQLGYLAWSWNAYGPCVAETNENRGSVNPYSLITSYDCPEPNSAFAEAVYQELVNGLP